MAVEVEACLSSQVSKQRDVNGGLLTSPRALPPPFCPCPLFPLFHFDLTFPSKLHRLLFSCLAYRRYALVSLHLLSLCLLPSHCSYRLTTWELHCQHIIPRLIDKSHTLVTSIPAILYPTSTPPTISFYLIIEAKKMHDLRRQALLESRKTVSRKAASREASRSTSRVVSAQTSRQNSRQSSRAASRHPSDDEDEGNLSDETGTWR